MDTLASGAQSRGGSVSDSLSHIVTALDDGIGKTLYLHTEYTDGILSFPFDGYAETLASTRGARRSSNIMYDSFGVSAYSYTDSWSESKTPNYFYNATASKSGSGYKLSSTYYWPGASYKMKFFAYAPKDNRNYVLSAAHRQVLPPSASLSQAMLTTKRIFSWQRQMNWMAIPIRSCHLLSVMPLLPSDSCAVMTCREAQ
ncbi:fimbrillin family protein [Bacteroides fragilis]